jgi:hypothetical protein
MSKRSYWVDPETLELVEITGHREVKARLEINTDGHYNDTRGQLGEPLGSRRRHKEYMDQHGLALADDFTNHWKEKAAERARFQGIDPSTGKFTGESGWDREQRKRDVAETIRELRRK